MDNSDSMSTSALKLIVSVGSLPLKGAVANALWGWHVAPTFGVAPPGVRRCMGLIVLIALVFHQYKKLEESDGTYYWFLVLGPLAALLVGWICK